MNANARQFDNSCHNQILKGDEIYQCQTCDTKSRYYLCSECFISGGHTDHKYVAGHYKNRKKMVIICNCGELHKRLYCPKHKQARVIASEQPIYTRAQLRKFNQLFEMKSTIKTIYLARLNQICRLDINSDTGKMIKTYFKNSNAHKSNIEIGQIYSVMRKDQEQRFVLKGYEEGRRMLLWHGTDLENLKGILEKGFKTPDQLPSQNDNGMFGPGLYFADRSSKSAQYTNQGKLGVLLLCEVAVGKMLRVGRAGYYKNALDEQSLDTVKAIGKNVPDRYDESIQGFSFFNIIVPAGKTIPNPNMSITYTELNYNEYITYHPARIMIKFIVQIKTPGYKYPKLKKCGRK